MPTPIELRHDYLWRVQPHLPEKGTISIFNRSHYEEVLVVRVHELVPETVWRPRYRQINDWERMLTEEGTTIVKFFLSIDRDEQRQRLEERRDDPTKSWKFSAGDLAERKLWDRYIEAFEECLEADVDPLGTVAPDPRPTGTGSGTWRCRGSSPRRSRRSIRRDPPPEPGSQDLVVE